MPNPGVVNNPAGVNSFDHFAPEPPYGEATKSDALKKGAPLAGGKVAAGAIGAPRKAQRRTQQPTELPAQLPPMQEAPNAPPTTAETWAAIAGSPGDRKSVV